MLYFKSPPHRIRLILPYFQLRFCLNFDGVADVAAEVNVILDWITSATDQSIFVEL